MKYVDICKQAARQCCREHTVFNDKRHKESDCEHCPLRRDFKAADGSIRRGICWFILRTGIDIPPSDTPYAKAERFILELEEVSYPQEWIDWIKSHQMVEKVDKNTKDDFESEEQLCQK